MKHLAVVLIAFVLVTPALRSDVSVHFAHDISVRITLISHSTKYPQRLPRPLVQPLPEYPVKMRAEGVTGEATVRFTLGRDGGISQIRVTKSSQPEFGQAVMAALQNWRFSPAL